MSSTRRLKRRGPDRSSLRATLRLLGLGLVTGVVYAAVVAGMLFRKQAKGRYALASRWVQLWSRMVLRIMGIRLKVKGPLPPARAFLASNHLGYLDIPVLSAALRCLFVSKSEVASWPLVGRLLTRTCHVTVNRASRRDLFTAIAKVHERLAVGQSMTAFLEGTSTGGDTVLPFNPGLLQAAIESGTPVVPVALRYKGLQPGVSVSDHLAFWKLPEHKFGPHVWGLLGLVGAEVEIRLGAAIPTEGVERKELAKQLHEQVLALYEGRAPKPARTREPELVAA